MFEKIKSAFEKVKNSFVEAVAQAKKCAVENTAKQAFKSYFAALPASGIAETAVDYIIYLFVGLFVLSILVGALAISNTSALYPVYTTLVGKIPQLFEILVTVIILIVVFFIVQIIRKR